VIGSGKKGNELHQAGRCPGLVGEPYAIKSRLRVPAEKEWSPPFRKDVVLMYMADGFVLRGGGRRNSVGGE